MDGASRKRYESNYGAEEEVPEQVPQERLFRPQAAFFRHQTESAQTGAPDSRAEAPAAADHDPATGTAHDGA